MQHNFFYSGRQIPLGWHQGKRFPSTLQKVKDRAVVYVSQLLFGYQVQYYHRGNISICTLEARTDKFSQEGLDKMIELGNMWLEKYSDGDERKLQHDSFHISNPDGVWGESQRQHKLYWL